MMKRGSSTRRTGWPIPNLLMALAPLGSRLCLPARLAYVDLVVRSFELPGMIAHGADERCADLPAIRVRLWLLSRRRFPPVTADLGTRVGGQRQAEGDADQREHRGS